MAVPHCPASSQVRSGDVFQSLIRLWKAWGRPGRYRYPRISLNSLRLRVSERCRCRELCQKHRQGCCKCSICLEPSANTGMSKFQLHTAVVVMVVVLRSSRSSERSSRISSRRVSSTVSSLFFFFNVPTSPDSGSGAHEPAVLPAQTLGEDVIRGRLALLQLMCRMRRHRKPTSLNLKP